MKLNNSLTLTLYKPKLTNLNNKLSLQLMNAKKQKLAYNGC